MIVTERTNRRTGAVTITQVIDFHELFFALFLSNPIRSPKIGAFRRFQQAGRPGAPGTRRVSIVRPAGGRSGEMGTGLLKP
jgi:hypothetical protein